MSKKEQFTSYGGGQMPEAAPSKQAEAIVDPSRSYGKTPKVLSISRPEKVRVNPTNPVAQSKPINSSFGGILYELHDRVQNYHRLVHFLDYQIPGQVINSYIHVNAKTVTLIDGVKLVGKRTGKVFGVIPKGGFLAYYLYTKRMRKMAQIDFVNNERKDGIFPSKTPPALNYTGFTATLGETSADANGLAHQLAGSKEQEPENWLTSTTASDGTATNNFPYPNGYEHKEFKFGELEDYGVFGCDRNFYFGEPLNLYVDYDTRDLGHYNLSPNNPFAGTPTALTGNIQLKNLFVEQCCELDDGAIKECMDEWARGDTVIPICWSKDDLMPLINGIQAPKMTFDFSDGTFLREVLTAAFPADGVLNQKFNGSNMCPGNVIDGTGGGKFRSFQTQLDNKYLQPDPISCVPVNPAGDNAVVYVSTDYKEQRPLLLHSLIQDAATYYKNWTWVDSFIGTRNPLNEVPSDSIGGALVAGSKPTGRIYTFTTKEIQRTLAGAVPSLLWYMHAVLTQYLVLKPTGCEVLPYIVTPVTNPVSSTPGSQVIDSR